MDFGTMLSVAQTIFAALKCSELKKICSVLGYKADLEKLQKTVEIINAVLLDAESKEGNLSHKARLYIRRLEAAVYDADDLIDKFVTLARQKKLTKGNKVRLLPLFREMGVAYNMSHGVKKIRENLSSIADDHMKFGLLSIDHRPIRKRREETCSYIYDNEIIGRDADLEKIGGILLDPNLQRDVSFLTIVGVGGLGKTALAQLVYNDENISEKFSLKLWACVSDQDLGHLDVGAVLSKILAAASGEKHDGYTLEVMQRKVRERLVKEKFLLVLDDVWTENRDEWLKLEGYLKGGKKGSRVLVTTRSTKTAEVVGTGLMYPLKGLSDDNSWRLFEKTAFGEGVKDENLLTELVDIGQKIVKRCANVPLAIRAVGTLLYGQQKSKWDQVLNTGLANIIHEEEGIMPILKFSYDNLEAPMKSCFSYCAVFPKDFVIRKDMLVRLWMAQSYVIPLEGQSINDAAEDYFSVLLRRCFFQDVEKSFEGEIYSCKIHDLMHDIAQELSGYKVCESTSNPINDIDKRMLHVSVAECRPSRGSFRKSRIRSYLQVGDIENLGMDDSLVHDLLAKCTCLRTLDLRFSNFKKLPDSIGKLLHLRYLDLSYNGKLEVIPKSITKLHNLIFLGIEGCGSLKCLPIGMGKLTNLQTLDTFKVGYADSSERQFFDELENLKGLVHLRNTNIKIKIPSLAFEEGSWRGEYLSGMQQLDNIHIIIERADSRLSLAFEEALLENLCPHSNIKTLVLEVHNGLRMPSWAMGDKLCTFLPNLVGLGFSNCDGLQSMAGLGVGKLLHLKTLGLMYLSNLEYIEDNSNPTSDSMAGLGVGGSPSFSSLEGIALIDSPKLKSWWSGSTSFPFLPRLRKCLIMRCPEMMPTLLWPNVGNLCIRDHKRNLDLDLTNDTFFSFLSSSQRRQLLITSNLESLKTVSMESIRFSSGMLIHDDKEVESLSEVGELFWNCFSSSLISLSILQCPKISSLYGGIEHLPALGSLRIRNCPNLVVGNNVEKEEEKDGIPWRQLDQTLRHLDWNPNDKDEDPNDEDPNDEDEDPNDEDEDPNDDDEDPNDEDPNDEDEDPNDEDEDPNDDDEDPNDEDEDPNDEDPNDEDPNDEDEDPNDEDPNDEDEDPNDESNLPEGIQYLTSLQTLEIHCGHKMKFVPNWMQKLTSLESLTVWGASKQLKERCQQPTGEDWHLVGHISKIVFK